MVIAIATLGGTSALSAVAGCMATAAGRFGSVELFTVALAGVLCPKQLHFAALPVATAVLFVVCCSRVDYPRVIRLVSGCNIPLQFAFCSHWRCHGC
jgi:hypothetical protein